MGKKKGGGGASFWDGVQGWRQVDVGDDFLLGSDEYGFCGLEELDASALGDLVIPGAPAAGEEQPAAADKQQQKQQQKEKAKAKKEKKRKQPEADAAAATESAHGDEPAGAAAEDSGDGGPETVAALKQQLAALAAENKQLKKKQKREAKAEKRAAAAAKRKEEKAAKRAAAVEAAAAQAAATAQAAAAVDVSAWRELQLLHPSILEAIAALGFSAPTQVQAECLPAAVRDRRDVIGAAQTGSGKTLAFGLPIMQQLVAEREAAAAAGGGAAAGAAAAGGEGSSDGGGGASGGKGESPLRALILAPTRELAMQVCDHLQAIGKRVGVWVVPIVGGISALKQERLLSKHPEVVVATPGRLWDLMREGHAHLTGLHRLSFLVIDEADRMVQQGHYGELSSILGAIPAQQQLAAPDAAEPEDEPEAAAAAEGDPEAAEEGEEAEEEEEGEQDAAAAASEEEEESDEDVAEDAAEAAADEQQQQQAAAPEGKQQPRRRPRPHRMQTFVFSATLTLPANLRRRLRKGGGGASGSSDLDSLMDKIPFRGKPKVVDLTSARRLAERVEEAWLACGEAERDEYLYCLLAKHPGRTIVFVNAISSVRRLGAILKLLGLPAQALHAGMQQRQRLKALDRFRADPNAILVATDVAARGLDIKDVRCVVHYQLPASVDVYVHRSGRTARAEAEGIAIALVTPKENARFLALLKAMKRGEPPEFPLDTSLLPAVHKRVRLAVRLDELERKASKQRAEKSWRQQHAEQLGIELSDEDEDEEEAAGRRQGKKAKRAAGGKRGPEDAETAAEVRAELAALLAEPLQPKFSAKWFTGGAAAAVMAAVDPSDPSAAGGKKKGKKGGGGAAAAAGAAGGQEQQQSEEGQQEAEAPAAAAPEPKTVATVSQAVALAQRRADSRSAQRAAAEAKQQRRAQAAAGQQGGSSNGSGGSGQAAAPKKKQKQAKDPRAAALQAALSKAVAAKHRKKAGGGGGGKKGMLVIPHFALGREAGGPDALQTLRDKLGGR